MQETPFFSIITVTLNNAAGLRKTRDSLATQNSEDFEWLVVDGGSTDGSQMLLAETSMADYTSEPDKGIFDAMNKGIERARGEYLLFLNGGDTLTGPDVLEKIEQHIRASATNPDFVYGDFDEEFQGGVIRKSARHPSKIMMGMPTSHQAMFFRREAIGNQRYSLDYKIAGDYDFISRFLLRTTNSLYCPLPVCHFEDGGMSQRNAVRGRAEEKMIRDSLYMCSPLMNSFIHARQGFAAKLKSAAPDFFMRLRNIEARSTHVHAEP